MQHSTQFYPRILKPVLDRTVAAIGLVVCAPLLAVLAMAVRVLMGSPVLFSQIRPGKDGKPFRLYKYRTMNGACDDAGQLLPDAERLTRFGRFLRTTSLDELPELWNVLRGEMSLVGPRPLLTQYLDVYTPEQRRRHEVKPGLTGLAQVNGRNAISWDEKFAYDLQYVEEHSLRLDLKILARTLVRVFLREGISAGSHSTMPVFEGTGTESEPLASKAA